MLWLKAFHIIAVITWFAGLFYLPRLFVYHVDADAGGAARFEIMERRLFGIMSIGGALSVTLGIAMIIAAPAYLKMGWLHVKLLLVFLLLGYHWHCYLLLQDFRRHRNRRSAKWFRLYNEIPSLFVVAIVILAVVKPF